MDVKKQLKQWREAEDFRCYHPAAMQMEQVSIEELFLDAKNESTVKEESGDLLDPTAFKKEHVLLEEHHKKETVVKKEADDFQEQGHEILIKEELSSVLNLVEKCEFQEENGEFNIPERGTTDHFHHYNGQFPSVNCGSQSDGGEYQRTVRGLLCKQYFQASKLKEHLMVYKNANLFKCNISSNTNDVFNQYVEVPNYEKSFLCEQCSKAFLKKSNLKRHLMMHKEKPFSCDVCTKSFSSNGCYQRHIMAHNTKKPFACNVCSKRFHKNDLLKRHLWVHNKEKSFGCDVCSKNFRTSSNLKRHLIIHEEGKRFPCSWCCRAFITTAVLQKHLTIHRNKKAVSCDVCWKVFRNSAKLKRHQMLQNKEKPFKCRTCSKAFRDRTYFKKHQSIHKNEKAF